jgi:two-component sensor histidine kinase
VGDDGPERQQRRRGAGVFDSIRARLLALLLIAAVPGAVVAAIGAHLAFEEAQRRFQQRMVLARDLIATRHLAAIEAAMGVVSTLALLLPPDGARNGGPACAAPLQATLARGGGRFAGLAVTDAQGAVRCAAGGGLAEGERLGGQRWFAALTSERGPVSGRFAAAEGGGVPRIAVAAPLQATDATAGDGGGAFAGAVVALLTPRDTALSQAAPDADGFGGARRVWLLDATGEALPLARAAAAASAMPRPADLRRAAAAAPSTSFTARSQAGAELFVAATRLGPDLILLVAEPTGGPLGITWRETALRFAGLMALFLPGIVAVVIGVSVSVVRPMRHLREAVANWTDATLPMGGDRGAWPLELRDLADGCERAAARLAAQQAALRAALERSELLMAEVHHRIKNNLQIVSSLLNLQAARITEPDARAEFEAARDRVRALATLHRHLYMHPDHETIDLRAFIEELGGQIFQASGERPGERIALSVSAPSLRISSDQAVPLALVITEAVSNALAFAFPGGRRGRLEVTLSADAERARLSVRDDGIGTGLDRAADRRGLGNQLVRSLARQLGGELRVEAGAGTVVTLDFPLRPPVARAPVALRAGGATADDAGD